jgi:electron transport complex protein RnfC
MKLTTIRSTAVSVPSADPAVVSAPAPRRVALPLGGPWGKATPVVSDGETVRAGQRVAERPDLRLPAVYAPISGRVDGVRDKYRHTGEKGPALVIVGNGSQEPPASEKPPLDDPVAVARFLASVAPPEVDPHPWPPAARLASPEVAAKALNLTDPPFDRPLETLILNALDRQPGDLLRRTVARRFFRELAEVVPQLRALSGARRIVFAWYQGSDLPLDLEEMLQGAGVDIVRLPYKYPIALEPLLVQAVTGKEVPMPEGDTRRLGCAVLDVCTAVSLSRSMATGTAPLTAFVQFAVPSRKMVTVYEVTAGMPLEELTAQTEPPHGAPSKVIAGGLFLGYAQHDLSVPLTSDVESVFFLGPGEAAGYDYRACFNCGNCVDRCPVNLMPNELGKYCEFGRFEEAERQHLFQCIECGLCAYVCPANRPMVHLLRYGKHELMQMRKES